MELAKELKMPCFVGIAGAIMLIISPFVTWLTSAALGDTMTGLNVLTDGDIKYGFSVVIAIIVAIIAIMVMIVPLFIVGSDVQRAYDILAVVLIVLSVVFIIFAVLFVTQSIDGVKLTDTYNVGIGYVLAVVGGSFSIFGGFMHFIRKRFF